jgi:hypothetical protein
MVVNADDPILPQLVQTAVEFMEQNPELLVAYPRWQEIDMHGNVLFEYPTYEYNYVDMVRSFHCMPNAGAIIRRQAIDLVGGRNPQLRWSSDIELWLRIGLHGPMRRIPHLLASHRVHPTSKTQAEKGIPMMQEYIQVMQNYFAQPNVPPEILAIRRQALSNIYNMAAKYVAHHDWKLARKWFLQSLFYCPSCRLPQPDGRSTRSWLLTLRVIFLPHIANTLIKRMWITLRDSIS